jgi:fumarylacetoacetase
VTAPTWVAEARGSLFDVDNLPYAIFSVGGAPPRVGIRIGDRVLDLARAASRSRPDLVGLLETATLNPLMAAGHDTWSDVRGWAMSLLQDEDQRTWVQPLLAEITDVQVKMPFDVADYVDFYASIDHATNVGKILRPTAQPLMPNWRYMPVGYHGRAGTVLPSGSVVSRPSGQQRPPGSDAPSFGPTLKLDIEAEVGFVVGSPTRLGRMAPTDSFSKHIFGVVGLNDWSARDIQAWEYVPLGPFLGKSFATTIAVWVTPLAALAAAAVPLPGQRPGPLPHLRVTEPAGYDIDLEVEINGVVVSRPSFRDMYWSPSQMFTHMTSNGASARTGDLLGSGTVSGPHRDQLGSLIELTWGGQEPINVGTQQRAYLEDGDSVVLRLTAPGQISRIGFGDVSGVVRARPDIC